MRQLIKQLMIAAVCSLVICKARAQQLEAARNTIQSFYKVYDSLSYLSFDVKYMYTSDTLVNDFTNNVVQGSYTMSGKNARYTIGDVEYLQNDSFFVAVFTKDRMMVVSNPPTSNAGAFLPLRSVLDSLLNIANEHYDITLPVEGDSAGNLLFAAKSGDTTQALKRFTITYEKGTNFINTLSYDFIDASGSATQVSDDQLVNTILSTPRRRTLTIQFSNYHFTNNAPDYYSQNNYIWQEDGEYKPVDKYKDYKVYNTRN